MLALFLGGNLYKKILIKRHHVATDLTAFGMGDVRLGGIIGIVIGWPYLLHALLLGIFISGIASISIFFRKNYKPFTTLPLSPYLIISTIITFIAINR